MRAAASSRSRGSRKLCRPARILGAAGPCLLVALLAGESLTSTSAASHVPKTTSGSVACKATRHAGPASASSSGGSPSTDWECWEPGSPNPCRRMLTAVDMLSPDVGFAVGKNVALRWDGEAWVDESPQVRATEPPHVAERPWFGGVAAMTPSTAWALENGGEMWLWEAGTWTKHLVDGCPHQIDMASATEGWAVGQSGFTIHWDGVAWREVASAMPDGEPFGLSVEGESDAWAVGCDVEWENGVSTHIPLVNHWDGASWQPAAIAKDVDECLLSIDMVSATDGWAVGVGGLLIRWDGNSWDRVSSPTDESLLEVRMVSANNGWAIGKEGVFHWNGNSWARSAAPGEGRLWGLGPVSATDAWAVGDYGIVIHWDGNEWQEVLGFPWWNLLGVDMVASDEGWAVGNEILHWDGVQWSEVDGPANTRLCEVEMASAEVGWAVGDSRRSDGTHDSGVIAEYRDGAWQEIDYPLSRPLHGIDTVSEEEAWAVGGGIDAEAGVRHSSILHYADGRWVSVNSPVTHTLWSVSMVGPDYGWAVGDGGTILHWDGGRWTRITSPVTADLGAVEMLSRTEGWASGNDSNGVVLRWDGSDWRRVVAAFESGPHFTPLRPWSAGALSFVSPSAGWMIGTAPMRWDGIRWWAESGGPAYGLYGDIDMVSETDGWAVGGRIVLRYTGTASGKRVYLPHAATYAD